MGFILVAFIILVGLGIYRHWYNSPQEKGKRGETRVHDILSHLPIDYHVLNDVVLQTEKGTMQIDHVVVSQYGIFVIETKNYSGKIYGNDSQQEWTQIILTDVTYRRKWYKTYTYATKSKFYNPVKQTMGHLFEIKRNLPEWHSLKLYPIVVFTGDADISDVRSNHLVVYDNDLISTILSYQTVWLSDDDVYSIIDRLTEKNVRGIIDNKTHVKNINANRTEFNRKIESGICPKCGGTLVQRTGRYGSFYGCSKYPTCKFTTH